MSHNVGGVREYVRSITHEMLQTPTNHTFLIYYSEPELLGKYPAAHEIYVSAPHKSIWDHVLLPMRLRHDQPDVVWFPQNIISIGIKTPAVVSVTDLLYFPIPEVPYREYALPDTIYARLMIPPSLRQAKHIMAISDHTAQDIHRLLSIPISKIKTIYLAPDQRYRRLEAQECEPIKRKFHLNRPFFFYAGTLSARKNIRTMIEAFGKAAGEIPHELILTGSPGFIEVPFDDLLQQYQLQNRVRRLGRVSETELVALYNLADAFVFPSLYEGFGIPPLEAFACDCPVISSYATSLSEVVGDAALTFGPHDIDTLAGHMQRVAHDSALRKNLIEAGRRRVAVFSYRRTAQELIALLEQAVA